MICQKLLAFSVLSAAHLLCETLPADLKVSVESKTKVLLAWSSNPNIVAAVKAHNASLASAERSMTNEKWKSLTLLDPFVRSYSRNEPGQFLTINADDSIAEAFVSGADETKVAFLSSQPVGRIRGMTSTRRRCRAGHGTGRS